MELSRRTILAGGAALSAAPGSAAARENPAGLRLLTSVDGVSTPPKGDGVMKFSFADPEPSVEFGGLLFGFQIITFENNYAIDPATVTVERSGDALVLRAGGLTWAGGQQKAAGRLEARLRRVGGAIEWDVSGVAGPPIKAIKTIVRGLPRGRVSVAAGQWRDLHDDEAVFEYPALHGGMATPLLAIEGGGKAWGVSAIQTAVRPARFALLPGPDGYKVELVSEQAGWERRNAVTTCGWRIVAGADFEAVAKAHFDAVERNWRIPSFRERGDAPDWAKHVACVLAIHGEHWTGYVFNDFARQLEILRWVARQVDPRTVMVFLPGWDARYYWDYPKFRIGTRTGGEAAFARLIAEGRKMGFRVALMFGANVANPAWEGFGAVEEAVVKDIYGTPFRANYVDWDGDRQGDGSMLFMNLGVKSWRGHLTARIADMIGRYKIDAYFLDICGFWENNLKGDMHLGTRALVEELRQRFPGVMPIAEMQYDAQMGFIPMNHVARFALYPQANYGHVASFSHLSRPAPGRGSSGVHEAGFGTYRPVTIEQAQIPTITFVDDTFSNQRDLVMRDIATAKARFAARGNWT